jgi:cysteine desulfurase
MKRIYLDNAATTPMAPEVLDAMLPYMREHFGNPSSTHTFGRQTKAGIVLARKKVAELLGCTPGEIIFTSGGTEADNMALRCSVRDLGVQRIVTTPIEHHAVLHTAEDLADGGNVQLVLLDVDALGRPDLNQLDRILSDGLPALVSLMHANNEIGTMINLNDVSAICRKHGALFHSDTVQTMGHYTISMQDVDIDFITCAAHKLHGPKGIGFLYINKKVKGFHPMVTGGAQERDMRGGTENLYGIIGLARALGLASEHLDAHQHHVQALKSHMIQRLQHEVPEVRFNGDIAPESSLYTVLNVSFPPAPNKDTFLFMMDINGVAVSGGSACSSGSNKGSHVLTAIGTDPNRINVRFSFSRYTTMEEVDFAVETALKVLQPVAV